MSVIWFWHTKKELKGLIVAQIELLDIAEKSGKVIIDLPKNNIFLSITLAFAELRTKAK